MRPAERRQNPSLWLGVKGVIENSGFSAYRFVVFLQIAVSRRATPLVPAPAEITESKGRSGRMRLECPPSRAKSVHWDERQGRSRIGGIECRFGFAPLNEPQTGLFGIVSTLKRKGAFYEFSIAQRFDSSDCGHFALTIDHAGNFIDRSVILRS
jgi:hypothetical protein